MWEYEYKLFFKMADSSIDIKTFEESFLPEKIRFNTATKCGQILELEIKNSNYLKIVYGCNVELVYPGCAISRFSRYCIEDIKAAENAIVNKRLFYGYYGVEAIENHQAEV
ncbi:hypothetical protein [Clostridium tagluense]|uniref:hypothetical protein n=1 Tax=Clostridium tagluense TaxID=360422 RepID=UPI001CF0DDAB|nr:hypothetical protein [Clostridium tagluense]MCB2300580.1 hypothetical protein [Clostridium tagluense]